MGMYLINGSPNVCDDLTAVGLELTAIKAKTDNLPSDPADQPDQADICG